MTNQDVTDEMKALQEQMSQISLDQNTPPDDHQDVKDALVSYAELKALYQKLLDKPNLSDDLKVHIEQIIQSTSNMIVMWEEFLNDSD